MRYLLVYFCMVGVYETLAQFWQLLEKIELGYAKVTVVDTVICWLISFVVTIVILACSGD